MRKPATRPRPRTETPLLTLTRVIERRDDVPARAVVRVRDTPDALHASMVPVDVDPITALTLERAPNEFSGVGLVTTDPSGGRVVAVADRTGAMAVAHRRGGRLRVTDRPNEAAVRHMVSILRRALDLPSLPTATPSTMPFYAAEWLALVADSAKAARPQRLTWPEVAACHYVVRMCGDEATPVALEHPEFLINSGRSLCQVITWETFRRAVADGRHPDPLIAPRVAAWMDADLFADATMAFTRTVADTARPVRRALEPDVWTQVEHVLRAWEVWPTPRSHHRGPVE